MRDRLLKNVAVHWGPAGGVGVLGLTFADTLASITDGWLRVAVAVASLACLLVGVLGLWVQANHNRQASRLLWT